jgi:hypothetical protein
MSGFQADWLALREPYDRKARNAEVADAMAAAFAGEAAVSVVDLACGTGSTLRAISSHLPARQNWRLVDNDLGLLLRAGAADPPAGVRVTTTPVDLARDLEAALDGPLDLVTTSALLDLVSEDWLKRFVVETAARNLPVYATLTFDGRATLEPSDPLDAAVVAGVNRHQRTDKGFGPALGPTAAAGATAGFAQAGYTVVQGPSDWTFEPRDGGIQLEILAGWASAAREIGDVSLADGVSWLTRRRELVAAGRSRVRVGHVDFFAAPTGKR